MRKRLLSLVLTACMVLTLLPTVALATNTTSTFGDFSVTYDDSGTAPTFDDSSNTLTFNTAGEYTIGMAAGKNSTSDRIVISASGAVKLNLNGVTIEVPEVSGTNALTVTSGTVTLNVTADSSLIGGIGFSDPMTGGTGGAGISGDVTITGAATLTATGGIGGSAPLGTSGTGGAGISGNVTVSGAATLIATGGAGGTGSPDIGRAGAGIQGNVNVSGTATLTAVSGSGAATIAISDAIRSGGGTITVGEGYTVAAGTDAASAAALPGDSPYTTTAQYVAITPPTPQAKWGLANDGAAPSSWAGSGTLDDAMAYANGLSSGTAYIQLQSDTNTTATLMFYSEKTTILDLNGKTIDAKNGTFSVLTVNGNLTLCDSSTTTVASQGKITGGNSSDYGGGVYIESTGSFTMTGGNITGNTSGRSGGGVYGNSTGNVMTMTGGSITGNHTQYNGGGVFIQTGGFTVGGTAKITGNTSGTDPNTLTNNVCLYGSVAPPSQQILTISTGTPLTTGASIGVRTNYVPSASSPLDFTGANSADYSGYFTSDNSSYVVQNSGTDNAQVVQLAVPVTQAPTVTAVSPTSGSTAGGTAVTITGTNLSNATAVKFGSASATSFTVTSSTSITATAPAGTGTVNITVTTAGGTSAAITADQFTYVSTAAEYAADAAPGTDYVLDDTVTPHTLTIKTAKGAAFWSASGTAYLDYTVKLAADIDVSDFLWTPVGNGSGDAFTGSFDGQGHSITGLTITAANNACVGLFGGTVGATIQNLCVSGTIEVTEADSSLYMGGIVGVMGDDSTIRNCCSHVAIRGAASGGDEVNAGGIVGLLNSGTIENCFSTGDVSATGADLVIAGGIYGAISTYNGDIGIVKNSYNTGSVSGSGSLITFLGALGGAVDRKIVLENCYYLSGAASAAFGSGSSANVGIFTADTADILTLLANLHSWVSEQASTAYRTWQADNAGSPVNDGYPVFGELWGTTTPVFDNCFGTVTTEKNTDPDAGNEEYHYTFSGWYTAPNGEGTRLGDTDPGAIGTRYYAKWIKNEKTVRTTALDLRDIGESKTYGAVKNGDVYTNADEGWTWYAASTTVNGAAYAANTLVLSGLTVHTAASTALSVPAGTTVVLTEGTANVLYSGYTSTNDEDAYTYGLYGAGDLNLRGGGSLNAVAGRAENIAKNHGCNSSGIYSEDTLTVSDAVTVTARGGIAAGGGEGSSSAGIFGKTAISIAGGTVSGTGSSADTSFGIYCGYDEKDAVSGTVVITGGAVTATGGAATTGGASIGLYGMVALSVSGGTVSGTGSTADTSIGIYCGYEKNSQTHGTLVISGGTVTAKSAASETPAAVYAGGTLTVGSAEKVATIANAGGISDSSGAVAGNTLTMSGTAAVGITFTTYAITESSATNGSYTMKVNGSTAASAQFGDTVTITPTASNGYELDTITVTKTGDTETTVSVTNGNFIMPAYAVTVAVTFKTASSPLDLTGVCCDVAAGKLTGTTTNMQYSLDGGNTWQDCAADNTTGLTFTAGTVKIRQKDNTTNARTVITIDAAAASSAPTLESKTSGSVTLTAMTGYEFSRDGAVTWQGSNVFSGLSGSTAYSFVARIKATASALPGTISTALSVTTNGADSSRTPTGGGTTAPTGAPVIVDGKTENIGTEKKSSDTTTVTVDQSKLGTNISGATSGSSVIVPVSENGSATASLVVKNIEDMAEKDMTLTVQTGKVAYNLYAAAIDTAALTAAFPGADMSKVPFNVTIANSSVSVEGETLVLSPVAFTVTATYNGKTVNVDTFTAYIDRVIEVTAEQAAKITTAVVVNADGSIRHVPTNVIEKDGKYYAVVSSRTNSTYALIQNEVTFVDAAGKWYEAAVNEMGSRKIIAGRSASVFDGDASITRAEFAAILVCALGLPANGTSTFSDVSASDWYSGAVAAAAQYGLVGGKGENKFDPTANITRQEAMAMLQRAAKLTDFIGTSSDLSSFTDSGNVDTWANDAAKWNVGSGLIVGSNSQLHPTDKISRAESATIILRLLQKAGLVDVRSKV